MMNAIKLICGAMDDEDYRRKKANIYENTAATHFGALFYGVHLSFRLKMLRAAGV